MLKIIAGIVMGVVGVGLCLLLWLMAMQNASMATGAYPESYSLLSKALYWVGLFIAFVGVIAGALMVRAGAKEDSDDPFSGG